MLYSLIQLSYIFNQNANIYCIVTYWYFGFGVLHGVQVNLVDDVSGTTVGPIFTGQESRG